MTRIRRPPCGSQTTARIRTILLILVCGWAGSQAEAGHESPFYPSHYPQEITLEVVDPATAATRLEKGSLHAYIGGNPFAGRSVPADVSAAESLGSYLVVTFNPASRMLGSREARCATARVILKGLAEVKEGFVFHPYPVTPYHPDYLYHFDVAHALRTEALTVSGKGPDSEPRPLKIKVKGKLAEALVRGRWPITETEWEATVEEVDLGSLVASRAMNVNGWLGPPWLKEGWFHASLLLSDTLTDAGEKQAVDALAQRLSRGAYEGMKERLTIERALVARLTQGCERIVAGYTVRREYFNSEYSQGIENIAQDSQGGFLAPIFIRTVKLKDFPWNGWLTLGIPEKPAAAWNPIGGFTDPAGRLIWFTVGDPAFFPAPYDGFWIPNRVVVTATKPASGPVEIPPDALLPETGTGIIRKVGPGKTAAAKIEYRVLMSAFHDGTPMTVADLFSAFVYPYRWGVRPAHAGNAYDGAVDLATALAREQLAGLRVLRVEQEIKDIGEVKLTWQIPVVEVYLRAPALDLSHAAVVAPPWSALPWHLLALMEEAVTQGVAAFSREEAARRGVAWLDLVRAPELHARLSSLVERFERHAYIPDPLKEFVTADEARQRWRALKEFFQAHGHFLVTNGPYRLAKWSGDSVVLAVFRDPSYPLGVGSFDRYVLPPRAYISKIERQEHALRVSAEIEKAVRVQRSYTMVREHLTRHASAGAYPVDAVCSYVVVGPDGAVRRAGSAPFADERTFTVDLTGLPPGRYTVLVALYLNNNRVSPDVKVVEYRVER